MFHNNNGIKVLFLRLIMKMSLRHGGLRLCKIRPFLESRRFVR